jgi:limonene-1,2-epoxide hydrolase
MDVTSAVKLVEAMEQAVAAGDKAAAARYLTHDVAYTVGARPVVRGIDAVIAYIAEQGLLARWEGHTLRAASMTNNTLVVEVQSHFTRVADNHAVSFPCADIYRFKGEKIYDWRVYADMSPFRAA